MNYYLIMKKTFCLLLFVLLIFTGYRTKASHLLGGELTYVYTGTPNEYLIHFRFYGGCYGTAADYIQYKPTVSVCISSVSQNYSDTITLNFIGVLNYIPAPPCGSICPLSSNDGYTADYQGIVQLPHAASDWKFVWFECCRVGAINSWDPSLIVDAHLNNLWVDHSSPTLNQVSQLSFCVGNNFSYDLGATQINGDSLTYSIIEPRGGDIQCPINDTTSSYGPLYSVNYPFSSSTPIILNHQTGILNFTPSNVANYIIAVLVSEYRNGDLIGTVRRDILIYFIGNCISANPYITSQPLSPIICDNDSTSYSLSCINASGYRWKRNVNGSFADIQNDSVFSGANSNILTVKNPPFVLNNFEFFCQINSSCGPGINSDTIKFHIQPSTNPVFNIDTSLCSNSSSLNLENYVSPIGGVFNGTGVNNTSFNPAISGNGNHLISYTFLNQFGCSSTVFDTIFVDACNDLGEIIKLSEYSIYPNPTSDILNLNGLQNQSLVAIYDVTGKLVLQAEVDKNSNNSINIASLSPGFYHCRIQQNNQTAELSFIKK
jgi:hypothetical protein